MPSFVPNIDLSLINKLYADKDLANKDVNKDANKEKKDAKKTASESGAKIQLQKFRDEYDPARPNDYEKVLEDRTRRQKDEEEKKLKEMEKIQEEEEYIPLGRIAI